VLIRRIRLGGARRLVPTPEEAIEELENAGEDADPLAWDASEWPRYIVGTAGKVSAVLKNMARDLHVEEFMILTVIHSHAARLHSYELLAESFGLSGRSDKKGLEVVSRKAI
jgi:hypothetical protein